MSRYTNIASATTTTLIAKDGVRNGVIRKITIVNHDLTDNCKITLYLDDGAGSPTIYTLTETTIPPLVTLVLEDNLTFDSSMYSLIITTSSVADITVIIK